MRNLAIFTVWCFATAGFIQAGDITYQVDETGIGIFGGSIVGTIQTDGTIGGLTASNIVGWNLIVTDGLGPCCGSATYFLTGGLAGDSSVSVTGSALSATATSLQFNFGSGPAFGTLGDFEILDSSNGAGYAIAVPAIGSSLLAVLPEGAGGDAGLYSFSPQPITIGTAVTPLALQGGTTSSPVFLIGAQTSEVTGTISGLGAEDYYSFYWGGGAFSVTASVTGAASGGSYIFSAGAASACNSIGSQTLNSGDGFSNTISDAEMPAGEYCIGLDANSANDPNFSLTFSGPVGETPEPGTFMLLLGGFVTMAIASRAARRTTR